MDGGFAAAPVRTTCPYCGVGCGVLAPRGGGAMQGDPAHPANRGALCSKGAALGETLSLDDRLLHPEVRGKRASWEAALDAVAEGFRRATPGRAALYVSGQLLTEDYYAANKLAKGVLGTADIDSNSRLCMASAVAAHTRAFGEDVVPVAYEDLELADLVVLVGSNLAWCHPVLHRRLLAAKEARGTKIVVLDPRRTSTCEGADLHLPLEPGSDVALFAALLAASGPDAAYVARHTEGAEEALAEARALAPRAAELTGLDPEAIARFVALWRAHPRTVTLWSQGVNQSGAGTEKANAIINCHLLTGRIGKPGAGPFSVTGQPNAMGGREVGALATMLAGHLPFDRGDALEAFWGLGRPVPRAPGRTAVEMFRALGRGDLAALWVMATNPAVSLPEGDRVRAALARAPFLVASEVSRRSDTAGFAHVRLPALAWGEKDGTVTNSERVISRQRAFLPAPGEARPDWWIVAQVAQRLGARGFDWANPAAIFREHAAVSGLARPASRVFDITRLSKLTDAEYDALAPTRWGPERVFGEGGFPRGRARLVPTPFRAPGNAPDGDFPLRLLTGRLRDQWHTMTRTGSVPRLMAHTPEPLLTLHPEDAAGLEEGAPVRVETPFGATVLRLALDAGQRRGTGFAPMHWTERFAPAARVNAAVNPVTDPHSFQPELKHTPFRVAPVAWAWQGFALLPERPAAHLAEFGALVPLERGAWRVELAGTEPSAEALARLRALSGGEGECQGEWISLDDPAAGHHRAALLREGAFSAAIFLGPDHRALPPRAWLASLLGVPVPAEARRLLLLGRLADGPPPSPVICACHSVTRAAIERDGGATPAGTGCGACRPEVAAILEARRVPA
jgi:assimilatory nitrate reductase catalytic subunit